MRIYGDRIIMNTYDTFTLPRIEAGVSGQEALDMLNAPIEKTEEALNKLSIRLSNINNKSAIIRQHVPIADGTGTGDLVYFDPTLSTPAFAPAKAELLSIPGKHGESIEAPCSRVEGIIISTDASGITGTLLCGGYFHSEVVASLCLGDSATAGTYFLSPFTAGKAVKNPGNKLRQPVLSYHGNGEFTLSLFYMAHDNHFHGSLVLDNKWVPAATVTSVTAPSNAIWCYNCVDTTEYINMGELTKATTAVFYNGILQNQGEEFIIENGYLWTTLETAPEAGKVTIFNHYPFAYDSPVVRGVESTNESLSVQNKNGIIQLTPNAFINGDTVKSPLAVSSISDNIIGYTPVITDVVGGPGIIITNNQDGSRVVSSTTMLGTLLDATSINHNGTTVTSDDIYQYITFPKGRGCSFLMQYSADNIDATTKLSATTWVITANGNASFNIDMYFVPTPLPGSIVKLDRVARVSTTLAPGGAANSVSFGETVDAMNFTGPGTLVARVSNTTNSSTINLFRVGFKLYLDNESTYTVIDQQNARSLSNFK